MQSLGLFLGGAGISLESVSLVALGRAASGGGAAGGLFGVRSGSTSIVVSDCVLTGFRAGQAGGLVVLQEWSSITIVDLCD